MKRPQWAEADEMMRRYYDEEWGFEVRDERGVFERVCLESFQAGLSWRTILNKRQAFREAFSDFDPDTVAAFDGSDRGRLMGNADIVRNRRKIEAAINNARATVKLRKKGGLVALVWSFHPEKQPRYTSESDIPTQTEDSRLLAQKLKEEGFVFIGPTTAFALMQAIGVVNCRLVD